VLFSEATLGLLKEGRREINWDCGVPFDMPFDFFNTNVPFGAIYATKGNEFGCFGAKRDNVTTFSYHI